MMMEILTALLVVITGFYALVTFRMLKANHAVIELMAEQSENMTRPYVTITPFLLPERIIITLRIVNTGRTAASNLKLTIDRDYYRYGRKNDDNNLAKFVAFNEVIESFPPDAELLFDLAQTSLILCDDADSAVTPALFSITAEYSYSGKTVVEKNIIDLRPYKRTNPNRDVLLTGIKEVGEKIEKGSEKLSRAIESLSLDKG